MNRITALHTAVRRLCQDRYAQWAKVYEALDASGGAHSYKPGGVWDYTDEARAIFPRYRLLDEALIAVERFVPDDFSSEHEACAFLIEAAESARDALPELLRDPKAVAAIDDELAGFRKAVLALKDLDDVNPIPFRRALGKAEADTLERDVVARFGMWYGGFPDRRVDIERLSLDAKKLSAERLEGLASIVPASGRLFELREFGASYELDVNAARFKYTGAEAYIVPPLLGWMFNASHEATVSFVGPELIARVKSAWHDWPELELRSNSL
jgi:hypothetical protein